MPACVIIILPSGGVRDRLVPRCGFLSFGSSRCFCPFRPDIAATPPFGSCARQMHFTSFFSISISFFRFSLSRLSCFFHGKYHHGILGLGNFWLLLLFRTLVLGEIAAIGMGGCEFFSLFVYLLLKFL